MLRLSLFFSICLHIILFGVVSVIVCQHTPQNSYTEKRFRVTLRKSVAIQSTASSGQPDKTSVKSSARKLLQTQDFSPSQPPLQKNQPESMMIAKQAFVSVSAHALKAQTLLDQPVQKKTPVIQESVVVAHKFPTPIPTPAPTPVPTKQPTPIPTPVPTKIPETKKPIQPVKTPDIPTPTTTIPPVPSPTVIAKSTALPESDFTPASLPRSTETTIAKPLSKRKNVGTDPVEKSEPKDAGEVKEQQQKELLKHYLQEVAAKIHAKKHYPKQARRKGWEGTVVIKLSILPTGDVEQALLVKSSERNVLDEAALQAIKKAQPFPRFSEKLTLPSITVNIPVQFVLGK